MGRVQNKYVRFSFHRNGHNLLQIVKAAAGLWTLCVAGYVKDTIVGACHRTSDGQEHKVIWHAAPERNTIFHFVSQRAALATDKNTRLFGMPDQKETRFFTYVSQRVESKAATVMSSLDSITGQGILCSSSFVSRVLGANWKTFIL